MTDMTRESYTSLANAEFRLEAASDFGGSETPSSFRRQTPDWRNKGPAGQRARLGIPEGDEDIVQFSAPIYFIDQDEGEAEVDLMRMGNCQGEVTVYFCTKASSGKPGERYRHTEGRVTFKDGETSTSIKVPILKSKTWCATLEFQVELSKADGCKLGLYLKVCRVKVIDAGCFPSNKYQKQIDAGYQSIKSIGDLALVWDFFKLAYTVEGVRWRTLTVVVLDQLKNVYLYFTITLALYLTDVLFAEEPGVTVELLPGLECGLLVPGDAEKSAAWLGFLIFGPMLLMHALDLGKVAMDVPGIINKWLRANLVRKYLNYSEKSRLSVSTAHMQFAMLKDVVTLSTGYVSCLRLLRLVGRIFVVLFFAYKESPEAMKIVLALPFIMCVFSALRIQVYIRAQDGVGDKEVEMSHLLNDVTARYELVAEYFQRPDMASSFIEKQKSLCDEKVPMKLISMNNLCFLKTLGPIFTGLYIALAAEMEISGKITLGTFITTFGLFNSVSDTFLKVYQQILEIYSTVNPLQSVVWYLNAQTDLPSLKQMSRKRRAMTRDERAKVRDAWSSRPTSDRSVPADHIPIKLVGMSFHYDTIARSRHPVFKDVNLELLQGNMVAVISKWDMTGRSTLLKILGQRVYPTEGLCFIPSHLRVLHVSVSPMVMSSTLWENLTFGARTASYDRVKEILEVLQLREVIDLVSEELRIERLGEKQVEHHVPLQETLSAVTMAKIHLARALIMNPEVMILQRPLSFYDQLSNSRLDVMNLIKEYVANRGIGLPADSVSSRRPRTVFFTAETMEEAEEADIIWNISEGGHIEVIPGRVGSRVPAEPTARMIYNPTSQYAEPGTREATTASMLSFADEAHYSNSYASRPAQQNFNSQAFQGVLRERTYEEDVGAGETGDWLQEAEADNVELEGLIADLEANLNALDDENSRLMAEAQEKRAAMHRGAAAVARGNPEATGENEELLKENKRLTNQVTDERGRCEDLVKSFTQLRQRANRAEQLEKQLVEEGRRLQLELERTGPMPSPDAFRSPATASAPRGPSPGLTGVTVTGAPSPSSRLSARGSQAGSATGPLAPRSRRTPRGSQASEVSRASRMSVSRRAPPGPNVGYDTTDGGWNVEGGTPGRRAPGPTLRACRVCVN